MQINYFFDDFFSSIILFSAPPVPLEKMSEDRLNWSREVAYLVNDFFSRPYEDAWDKSDSFYALKCGDGNVVFRPNHSLAHGMRQAYLAVDIVLIFRQANGSLFTDSKNGERFISWIRQRLKSDLNFLKKVEMANAFQRTGRKSEISRGQDKEKYESYLRADKENFSTKVTDYVGQGKLFKDSDEANLFRDAIVTKFDEKPANVSDDLYFLSKIFFAAHLFDLRRLPNFDKGQLYREISAQLFGTTAPNEPEKEIFNKVWSKAGDYLAATGDRDMDDPVKNDWNKDVFCAQAKDPGLMATALQIAKTNPEGKLLKSIIVHAQAMRELKEKINKTQKRFKSANELRDALENAPYTASEGYLKILLGNDYKEVPLSAKQDEARAITTLNVRAFLSEPKKLEEQSLLPRVDKPDDHYVNVLVDAMMEERKYKGKIVFYHTTEPEIGFLFDVYTQLRNFLRIEGGDEIQALRAIDRDFMILNEAAQRTKSPSSRAENATVKDFMEKFKTVADSDDVYRTMGLSTNFSLFGSDQQKWADSYNMFFEVKDKRVATQPLELEKFFGYIEQYTGIPMEYRQYKQILERFILNCGPTPCRNGRLVQIFVDPLVVNDMAYFSVLLGAPVLKEGVTQDIAVPIAILRTAPTKLLSYLEGTSGGVLSYVESNLLRPNKLQLHDLQARLFMRPDLIFNPKMVRIKSYFRYDMTDRSAEYRRQIKKLVSDNLVTWLKAGAPSDPDAFQKESVKLKTLVGEVYRGSTGRPAPSSKPMELEEQFMALLVRGNDVQAARLLNDNYAALKDKMYTTPRNQKGGGGVTTTLAHLYLEVNLGAAYKVLFDKGLYPGGDIAYKVFSLLHRREQFDFVQLLFNLKDSAESCRLYLIYFGDKKEIEGSGILAMIKALDLLNNDKEAIETAEPLLAQLNYKFPDRTLKGIGNIPRNKRKEVVDETMIVVHDPTQHSAFQNAFFIQDIMAKVWNLRDENKATRNLFWSVVKQISGSWNDRLNLIEGVRSTDVEILKAIEANLKSPPNPDYRKTMKEAFKTTAFRANVAPLIKLFSGQAEVAGKIGALSGFAPQYRLKDLASEMSFLVETEDMVALKSAAENFDEIASKAWILLHDVESVNLRHLILAVTKKIVKEHRDWSFGLHMIERLRNFEFEMLQAFSSPNYSVSEILDTPLTEILWKKDIPSTRREISVPFTYDDVLNHAKTSSEISNISFLQSLEGRALVFTFIVNLNKGMVPTNACTHLESAFNRVNPGHDDNKSLIAMCVLRLAQKTP